MIRGQWVLRVALAAAVLATAASAGAAVKAPAAGQIVVGYAIAKTGGFATYDVAAENGGKMAAAAINAKGGILGKKIKIIDCDTKSQLNQSGPCAQQLIGKGAQVIISTADYDFGGGAYRAAAAKGLLGLGFAGDTRLGYHGVGPTVFNTYQGSNAEGAVTAEFAYSKGWRKPYILTDTINSYPATVSSNFETRWKQLAGKGVAGKDLFLNSDASIATQVSRIRSANPDVILIASFPPGGASAIKQIRAAGINTPIVTDEAFDGSAWISAIPNLSNVFIPHLASADQNDPSAERNAFFRAYQKFTGKKSVLAGYPAMGYAQIQIMAKGMTDAKSTKGKAVAAAIAKLHKFPTMIGPTTYDWKAKCNVPSGRPYLFFQITNGKEKLVKSVVPKQVPPFKC